MDRSTIVNDPITVANNHHLIARLEGLLARHRALDGDPSNWAMRTRRALIRQAIAAARRG